MAFLFLARWPVVNTCSSVSCMSLSLDADPSALQSFFTHAQAGLDTFQLLPHTQSNSPPGLAGRSHP